MSNRLSISKQAHIKKRKAAQNKQRGINKCSPFAQPAPLMALAVTNNLRVQADAGIVDKNAFIDRADININAVSASNDANGFFKVERDAQVFGEMIERTKRQNAEYFVSADKQ